VDTPFGKQPGAAGPLGFRIDIGLLSGDRFQALPVFQETEQNNQFGKHYISDSKANFYVISIK
jgi:hypothetical protein